MIYTISMPRLLLLTTVQKHASHLQPSSGLYFYRPLCSLTHACHVSHPITGTQHHATPSLLPLPLPLSTGSCSDGCAAMQQEEVGGLLTRVPPHIIALLQHHTLQRIGHARHLSYKRQQDEYPGYEPRLPFSPK